MRVLSVSSERGGVDRMDLRPVTPDVAGASPDAPAS